MKIKEIFLNIFYSLNKLEPLKRFFSKTISIAKKYSRRSLPYLFMMPFFAYIMLTWIGPVVITIILSFTKTQWTITNMRFIGLKNFEKIFTHDVFAFDALKVTVLYVSTVIIINAFFSLILAIFTTYFIKNETIASGIRLLWLIPRITPAVIYAVLWRWFVDPDIGMLNRLLSLFGLPTPSDWRLTAPYSQILMILINGYVGASFGMIIYSAAITSIPRELFYAASVDGASDWQIVRRIILPLLKWPIFFVTSWQTLSLLSSYEHILAFWGEAGTARAAEVEVWALYSYTKAFYDDEYGYGAALSVFLVIIGIFFIIIFFKIFGFRRMMQPSRVEV